MRSPRLRAPTHGHSARDMLSVSMWIVFKLCEQLFEKDARALVAHRTLAYLVGVVSADGIVIDIPEWVYESAESFGPYLATVGLHDVESSDKVRVVLDQDWITCRDVETGFREALIESESPLWFAVLGSQVKVQIANAVVYEARADEPTTALLVFRDESIFDGSTGRWHYPPRQAVLRRGHHSTLVSLTSGKIRSL